ncbi:MAG: hypothetical protein KJ886_04530 [Candidatus Thermoplasmatota archaeon]|nr:hypothetical protein [Candidatus Thermoplasmatota archaeon]
MKIKLNTQRLAWAIVLIALGVISRIYLRICLPPGNNFVMFDMFAVVAVFALLAGCLVKGVYSLIVPICIMCISDLYLGNNSILLFTWSGFAFVGLMGYTLKNRVNYSAKFIGTLTGMGISSVLVYDFWTNLGWWYLFYPRTLDGLALCYTMALPFTVGHLISTSVVVPLVSIPALYIHKYGVPKINIAIKPLEHYTTICLTIVLAGLSVFIPVVSIM